MAGFNAWQKMPADDEQAMGMQPPGVAFQGGYGFGQPAAASFGPPTALAPAPLPVPDDAEIAKWAAAAQPQQIPSRQAAPTPQAVAPEQLMGDKPPRGGKIAGTTEHTEATSVKSSNLQQMMDELNNKGLDSLKQQGLNIESLKKQLGETQGRDMPLDLTGLAALTDTWTGSNFVGAYKPQETNASRRGEIERLQGAIANGANNLSERETDLLKSKLGMKMAADKTAYDQGRDKTQDEWNKTKFKGEQELGYAKINAVKEAATAKAAKPAEIKPDQYKAASFGKAMEDAEKNIQAFYADPKKLNEATGASGALNRSAPGLFKNKNTNLISQSERHFINAKLRRDSGASISDPEFASAELEFFARSGDSPETLANKAQARGRAIEGMRLESGDAWGQFKGSPNAAAGTQPATVTQGGHTYTLNPKTGKYE